MAAQCSPELVHVDGRLIDLAGDGIVERAGEDAGGGGLADAAHAGEHVGLRDAAAVEGVGERPDHRLLADQIGEALRPVFAGKHPVGAGTRLLLSGAVHAVPCSLRPSRAGPSPRWDGVGDWHATRAETR